LREVVFSSTGDVNRASLNGRKGPWPDFVAWFRPLTDSAFTLLFPANCRLCEQPLAEASRLPVCRKCLEGIPHLGGWLCAVCGELLGEVEPDGVNPEQKCVACRESAPRFAKAAAFGSYDGNLRSLIHLLKYEQVRPAARPLGRWVATAISQLSIPEEILVVPVPLYPAREWQRGFNQSELIAQEALNAMPERSRMTLARGLLVRRRETRPQVGLTPEQRRENMRGAFEVTQREAVKGHSVLLVDDVLTTGVTASECARVLLRSGAERVWVATAARALKHSAAGNEGLVDENAA
jgi:ComF family protein